MNIKDKRPEGFWLRKLHRIIDRIAERLNDYRVEKKLVILYVCCVLFPLIITDSVILAVIVSADRASSQYEMQNISSAMKYNLTSTVDKAVTVANNIYTNPYLSNYLNHEYETPLEYYEAYLDVLRNTLLIGGMTAYGTELTLYTDNDTIINGAPFTKLDDSVRSSGWYRHLMESGQDRILYIYYDEDQIPTINAKRKVSLIRKLNFYQRDGCEKLVKLDLDYLGLVSDTVKMNYEAPVYVCSGGSILLSNEGHSSIGMQFERFEEEKRVGYEESFTIYGQDITVYVLNKAGNVLQPIWNNAPLILFLILVNAVLPWFFMRIINRSFTGRLQELSGLFEQAEDENLQEIENVRGKDEIGTLMWNYNRMVARINDLIQTVYVDKLKEQEINIARQNAELLALHSQINPHFLFNALESIRMHSLLKREDETAHMVEKLATMERQYVDWGTDFVTIGEEMGFVEAYLELQKYRFGDRLSYSLEVDEACRGFRIPRLTLVTFAENACVHGIESKSTPGWIFVRVFTEGEFLCLEVEDTGNGITEPFLSELREKMASAGIASLKKTGSVGIMNACLRLRMMTKDQAKFELESEERVGTIVTVKIPLSCMYGEGRGN